MTKKGKYWVTANRISIKATGETLTYGAEFPDLGDEEKMEILLAKGAISTKRPSDAPEPEKPGTPSPFTPSQPYVEPKKSDKKKPGEK